MSTGDLKSIDKLRNIAYGYAPNIRRQVNMACDEIEQEIAERYIELPLDADGVPWHIGDITENGNTVNTICFNSRGCYFSNTLNDIDPSMHTHFKPRTIEDVLRDVVTLCANTWKDEKSAFRFYGVDEMMRSANLTDYAEEIRGMMA